MARSLNQVTLLGNITRDPELRTTPSGQSVVSMSLALNRSYKDSNGEWREATDYVDLVCWGPLAERVSEYLGRGSKILVTGRLQSRSWEAQDGSKRSKIEVLCSDVTFLDGKPTNEKTERSAKAKYDPNDLPLGSKKDDVVEDIGDEPINLDDIPF